VRACALRTTLLRPHEWEDVAGVDSAAEVIAWFKERGVLAEEVSDVAGAERAAHRAVIHSSSALLRFSRGPLADLLGYFLHYYDLINLESVIQRIHAMVEGEDAQGIPYDTGSMGIFDDVLGDVRNFAALSRLVQRTPFAAAYEAGLRRYYEDEDVSRLIETIEVAFFADWVEAAKRCGFKLKGGTDNSGLAVFLVERIIESAVRLKVHREADQSRVVEWLSLVTDALGLELCLDALDAEDEDEAVMALATLLLPKELMAKAGTPGSGPTGALSVLRVVVLRRALKAGRGIVFSADFLTSFLVLQIYQALELTLLLESKETGIADIRSAYGEVAA
jgi:vacuolar-type H+-ATPase subunit C/Vma6